MHDIKWIRKNSEEFDNKLKARGLPAEAEVILKIDEEYRGVISRLQKLQQDRNDLSKSISIAKKNNEDTSEMEGHSVILKIEMEELEEQEKVLKDSLDEILLVLPNMISTETPIGASENDNVEVARYKTPTVMNFPAKAHYEIGESLGMMDFELASKLSGSRFTVLKRDLAMLHRALASYMLDTHTQKFGYSEVQVPILVNEQILYGTGQLPKFAEDSFSTTNGKWLIPTAEVPLTNFVRDSFVDYDSLPIRLTAYTECFRSEAGAAGRDTRGMIRNHQFGKVELVSIVHPENEIDEFYRMASTAEAVLKGLDIPYRVIELCSGDIGFSARRTFDLEVWLPSEGKYREISSCSMCGQFQARRMNAKYKKGDEKDFLCTLNGSGVAVGRALITVLENYQQADGSIVVPEVLQGYMNGKKEIR